MRELPQTILFLLFSFLGAGLIAPLGEPQASETRAIPRQGFVHRSGKHFTLDGKRVRFIGANADLLQGEASRSRIDLTVGTASKYMNVIRVWAFSDGPLLAPTEWEKSFYFRMGPSPEHQLENAYLAADRALARAREGGLKVILVLSNHWPDFGGIQRYYEWFNTAPRPTNQAPDHYGPNIQEALFFYTDPRAKQAYQAMARSLLTRRNTITGELYRDDPTILAIELMNEPGVDPAYAQAQKRWFAEMAAFVRSLAPHHLIGTGVAAPTVPHAPAIQQWRDTAELVDVDYFDLHVYPGGNHGWSENTPTELDEEFSKAVRYAHDVARKPIVLGEIGFTTETADFFQSATPKQARLTRQDLLLRTLQDALLRHDFDAALFWIFMTTPNYDWQSHRIHPEVPEDLRFLEGIQTLRGSL